VKLIVKTEGTIEEPPIGLIPEMLRKLKIKTPRLDNIDQEQRIPSIVSIEEQR
jgi:hypothetical protein